MKLSHLFAAALIAGFTFSFNAHATTVDLSLTGLSAGQSGSVTSSATKTYDYFASGLLPADTEIVFTYTSKAVASGILTATGTYSSGNSFVFASATSVDHKKTSNVFPVLATANIGSHPVSGTITIENLTSSAEKFSAYFLSLITSGKAKGVTVSYLVSSVPLPATFVLFTSGLFVLAGFAAYRKKANG